MTMKLGTETGNVFNSILSESVGFPKIGEGATEFMWTDRRAYTVIYVSLDGKKCSIQEDNAKPLFQGMTDSQSYEYSENLNGHVKALFFKWGAWRTKAKDGSYPKINIRFGMRNKYHDYSF